MMRLLLAYLLAVLIVALSAVSYDSTEADVCLYLSSAAFCDPAQYESHVFTGIASGFNTTLTIHETKYDTYGYVGYLPSRKTIYVTYRGSEGWQNWMANIETTMTHFEFCADCKVHKGFYTSLLADFDNVTKEVKRLMALFPDYVVKTTGHSLGAALSQLASMQLTGLGVPVHSTYNFGQPRTGNAAYSVSVGQKVPSFRHVHYKDPVPHVPPEIFGFVHECGERYEPNQKWDGTLDQCGDLAEGNCEDDGMCAQQWKDYQLNPDDHMTYLGVYIACR